MAHHCARVVDDARGARESVGGAPVSSLADQTRSRRWTGMVFRRCGCIMCMRVTRAIMCMCVTHPRVAEEGDRARPFVWVVRQAARDEARCPETAVGENDISARMRRQSVVVQQSVTHLRDLLLLCLRP